MIWKFRSRTLDLTHRGMIMGILNVTPDSFSDGGKHATVDSAVDRALAMVAEGAEIIDIGGESTRPGAEPVSAEMEMERVLPVIRALSAKSEVMISIDTMKPEVASAALEAGAEIINDVTGFRDAAMRDLAARTQAGCVVMHMQGEPRTMQHQPVYENVVEEIRAFFQQRLDEMVKTGIDLPQIVVDPGIGFGKKLEHNRALLKNLAKLQVGNRPLLLGISRKSFISAVLGGAPIEDREWPTVALTSAASMQGVRLHRVHDVLPNVQAMRMMEAIQGSSR